ncbi:1928_t:CDS:2, partial [Cetraspora pellucida]
MSLHRPGKGIPLEDEDASRLKFNEGLDSMSETQFALSISETNALLRNVRNRSNPPKSTVFSKTLEYVDQFTKMRDEGQLNDARRTLSKYNLHQFELPLLLNLLPANVDEAKTLIP